MIAKAYNTTTHHLKYLTHPQLSSLQVGSRMVIVASGFVMIIMGMFGKIGAIFATIPTPVVGGMFLVMFGVIMAAGVSSLQVKKRFINAKASH